MSTPPTTIPPPLPADGLTETQPPPRPPCRRCRRAIDPEDLYCRYCGYRQQPRLPWLYHPIAIILLAFFILGPFALPLVWRSPYMGTKGKWILSLAIIGITAAALVCAWKIAAVLYHYSQTLSQQMFNF